MKKRNNRFLTGTLAGLMMLTMLPVTALAVQEGADDAAASDTPNNIVNVVSDDENGQQAVNINIAANGGNENAQESADDSENAQGPLTTAAAAVPIQPQLISGRAKAAARTAVIRQIRLRRQSSSLLRRLVLRRMKVWIKLSALQRTAIRLKSVRILPLKKAVLPS